MKLLIRWAISALSLFTAAWFVPGIHVDDGRGWVVYAVMAVILGLANALIRPLLKLLTCPLIMLTLGLFTLVINAVTLLIASAVANNWLHVGFYVDGFWPAFWGALIVSIVSVVLNAFVSDDNEARKRRERRERRSRQ
jgi:putative membrane protein